MKKLDRAWNKYAALELSLVDICILGNANIERMSELTRKAFEDYVALAHQDLRRWESVHA